MLENNTDNKVVRRVKPIRITDYSVMERIVTETFKRDEKLFEKYHLINNDKLKAISDTVRKIVECVKGYDAEFYCLSIEGRIIGYVNIMPKQCVIHSFGLRLDNRNESNKLEMLYICYEFLSMGYAITNLYKKNERAVSFMVKNGFQVVNTDNDTEYPFEEFVTLVNRKIK